MNKTKITFHILAGIFAFIGLEQIVHSYDATYVTQQSAFILYGLFYVMLAVLCEVVNAGMKQ